MVYVLAVYTRPYDPHRPLVCMDEVHKQLLAENRNPLPAQPGKPARYDYEYKRAGVANLFMFYEPLSGKRYIEIMERRTRQDWAHVMREISDTLYPEEEKIVVVLDNLNTHTPASFYVAFETDEARRLTNRFEFHYLPKRRNRIQCTFATMFRSTHSGSSDLI